MLTCRLNAWYTNIADNRCMPSNNWYATVPPHPARLDECHEPSDPGGYDKKNSLAVWRVWIHHWFFGTKQNGRRKRTTFILSSILLSKQACPIAKVCERTLVTAWLQTRISKLKQPKLWQQIFEFQALRFDLHSHGCNMVCITANVFELTALCPVQMQTHSQHHGNIQSKLEHQKKTKQKKRSVPPIYLMLRHSFEIDAKHCRSLLWFSMSAVVSEGVWFHMVPLDPKGKMETQLGTQMYSCHMTYNNQGPNICFVLLYSCDFLFYSKNILCVRFMLYLNCLFFWNISSWRILFRFYVCSKILT